MTLSNKLLCLKNDNVSVIGPIKGKEVCKGCFRNLKSEAKISVKILLLTRSEEHTSELQSR